mmetsp:Transcript_71853/g.226969  ORF Transcript_71853/g.226969 Transcript_71853/m.226969 type:complete len:176 (+) Transcript_71853:388-915(+)
MGAPGQGAGSAGSGRFGPWTTPKNVNVGTLEIKRNACGLCEMYFTLDNLPGLTTHKSILSKRAEWGLEDANEKLRTWAASRLYNRKRLCAFCTQLVVPDMSTPDFPDWDREALPGLPNQDRAQTPRTKLKTPRGRRPAATPRPGTGGVSGSGRGLITPRNIANKMGSRRPGGAQT